MKKIALLLGLVFFAGTAHADTCAVVLMPAFGAEAANTLCGKLGRAFRTDFGFASGKTVAIQEATSASACSGTLTANGATPVVTSTTCATTGSRIFLTRTSAESTALNPYVSAISNGVSFSVTSEAGDTGTFNWFIVHEAQ